MAESLKGLRLKAYATEYYGLFSKPESEGKVRSVGSRGRSTAMTADNRINLPAYAFLPPHLPRCLADNGKTKR